MEEQDVNIHRNGYVDALPATKSDDSWRVVFIRDSSEFWIINECRPYLYVPGPRLTTVIGSNGKSSIS